MRPSRIADVGGARLGARAVDDDAVADREVDAHRLARSSRVALDVDPAVGDHDAVALARGCDGDLAVEHVVEHGRRLALERIAEAAASGRGVREPVALPRA